MDIMDSVRATSVVGLLLSLLGAVIWLWYIRKNRSRWEEAVAPLSFLINCICFQIAFLGRLIVTIEYLAFWSSIIRLHGILLFVGFGWLAVQRRKTWTPPQ